MKAKIKLKETNIENIIIGDVVLSYDLAHKRNVFKKVTDVFTPLIKANDQVAFELNSDTITMSNIHRMWVNQDGNWDWVEAGNVNIGDELVNLNQVPVVINKINKDFNTDEIFYDLCVEDTHNYFVGNTNYYLSHNSATTNFAWFHYDILDILVLKNNAGTDDNRVKKLDYCIGLDKLILERFIKNEDITLFSYHECPQLWNNFGLSNFKELYEIAEADKNIKFKKKISAKELMFSLAKERFETGRIYVMFVDHANEHGTWNAHVDTTNLCTEIVHPIIPIKDLNDVDGEIGVCILAALNLLNVKDDKDLEKSCDIAVRMLDSLIDYQNYFVKAAGNFATKRRSLGIGITNLAACLAREGLKYWDKNSPNYISSQIEKISYYLIKSSVQLAKEFGPCEKFNETKYSNGILPIDTYKKEIDSFVTEPLHMDWETLRSDIKKYGMRNSTLMAQMPCESSAVISNSTNGIEPPRSLISFKGSKANILPVVVPNIDKYKDNYTLAFDMPDNDGQLKNVAAMQKFIDMAISTNTYYVPSRYKDNKVPIETIIRDILTAYKYGLKTLYYANTDDGDKQTAMDASTELKDQPMSDDGCVSGACAI